MKRPSLGEVVQVQTQTVTVRLRDYAKGSVVAHSEGLSSIGQPGDLIGIEGGSSLLVARIEAIQLFDAGYAPGLRNSTEAYRTLQAVTVGRIIKDGDRLSFDSDLSVLPPLGAQVIGLTSGELRVILAPERAASLCDDVLVGNSITATNVPIRLGLNSLLTRHLAVLGSSGQGKTHFVASILQKLLRAGPNARIVIFDIHDEYRRAFQNLEGNTINGIRLKQTVLGRNIDHDDRSHFRVPYYALGLGGLSRLILPSEKTQRPALNFAVDKIRFVDGDRDGSRLVGSANNCFFGDGRDDRVADAYRDLNILKTGNPNPGQRWPHMSAITHLAADWACLKRGSGNRGPERSAWDYGNVAPMIQRINRLVRDTRFTDIVNVEPSAAFPNPSTLQYDLESKKLVDDLFGEQQRGDWNVHIIGLKYLPTDLMPYILGSLLELYAEQLFSRGPGNTFPTMLVLEEAHHYLRQIPGDADTGLHSLAYERLAREGRKFQVSMLISTQRPSEVSPTVLAQCGTWAVFRLTNDRDQAVIGAGSEKSSRYATSQIPGLGRGQMVMFGDALPLATKIQVSRPHPQFEPSSSDASFEDSWSII